MKFLESSALEELNSLLDGVEADDSKIYGRLEMYSCKAATTDKKLVKELELKYQEETDSSMSSDQLLQSVSSPFGPLTEQASRKTLYYLIGVLNCAFPDYDFQNVRACQFVKQRSFPSVMNSVNTNLLNMGEQFANVVDRLWIELDKQIVLSDCDIYMYESDMDSDPYCSEDDQSIWSFTYFFYNKKMKRILFFNCRSVNQLELNASNGDAASTTTAEASASDFSRSTSWIDENDTHRLDI